MESMTKGFEDPIQDYTSAMRDYLAGQGEAALQRAYEAGRHALVAGVGVLDILAAHQRAIIAALETQTAPELKEHILHRALGCLAESLSPYEMVLRGAEETHGRLQMSLGRLERVDEQLRARNEELIAAHRAVEKERSRYYALFDFAPDGY